MTTPSGPARWPSAMTGMCFIATELSTLPPITSSNPGWGSTTMSQCPGNRPLGADRQVRPFARGVLPGRVDVVGMGRRIDEATPRPRHPHDVVDERRRPGEICILLFREDAAVLIVDAGEALLAPAERQAQPPIFADPLPQPFGAFVVERQLGMRQDDGL